MDGLYSKEIPLEAHYLFRKGTEKARLGDIEGALKYYKQVVVIVPRYAKAFYEIGNCHASLGRNEEAISAYNYALHIDPLFTEAEMKRDALRNKSRQSDERS